MTPRRYDLHLLRRQKLIFVLPILMLFLFPALFLFVLVGGFGSAAPKNSLPPGFPWFPLVIFWFFGAIYSWTLATTPYRITVTSQQELEFKSLARTLLVPVQNIVSIAPSTFHWVQTVGSVFSLKYRGGQVRFIGQFTGQHILLSEVEHANPRVTMIGC